MPRLRNGILCALIAVLALVAHSGAGTLRTMAGATKSEEQSPSNEPWWEALPRPVWSKFQRIEQSQRWFEVYAVSPGVLAIYEPGHWEQVVSYLISGQERALLFDTGMGIGDMKRLVGELTRLEVVALNSHSHYDHVGGNHQFESLYGTGSDYTRRSAKGLGPSRARRFLPPRSLWPARLPRSFKPRKFEIKPFRVTHEVSDGEIIDLGGRTLEVLLTPGHSPDSLCLFDRKNRALYTGDTFYAGPLYAHLPGSDLEAYVASAVRLGELREGVDVLFPAHAPPALDATYLETLAHAFRAISEGGIAFTLGSTPGFEGRQRHYRFQGFRVIVPE